MVILLYALRSMQLKIPPVHAGLGMDFLLAEDTCVALGWRNLNLLANHTQAEDMDILAMGLVPLGVIEANFLLCKRQLLPSPTSPRRPQGEGLGGCNLGGPTRVDGTFEWSTEIVDGRCWMIGCKKTSWDGYVLNYKISGWGMWDDDARASNNRSQHSKKIQATTRTQRSWHLL